MMITVISDRMSFRDHPFYKLRARFHIISYNKKSRRCAVFFESVQNRGRIAVFKPAVERQIKHLFLRVLRIKSVISSQFLKIRIRDRWLRVQNRGRIAVFKPAVERQIKHLFLRVLRIKSVISSQFLKIRIRDRWLPFLLKAQPPVLLCRKCRNRHVTHAHDTSRKASKTKCQRKDQAQSHQRPDFFPSVHRNHRLPVFTLYPQTAFPMSEKYNPDASAAPYTRRYPDTSFSFVPSLKQPGSPAADFIC